MGADHVEAGIGCLVQIGAPPIAMQGGVEHVSQPVNDDRLPHLRQDAIVDMSVVVGRRSRGGEGTARHQDHLPAKPFHEADLLLIGRDDRIHTQVRLGQKVIGARATGDMTTDGLRLGDRAGNQ